MESKKYNKLVHKTKKQQTHRDGEKQVVTRGERQDSGREKKRVIMGLYKIVCETFENCKAL